MNTFKKIIAILNQISEKIEEAVNIICVFCLTLQTVLICVQVIGRYIFKSVPAGTDEIALLCMVWMAILSMCLSVRDDSHLKLELADLLFKEGKIKYFQLISSILTIVFSIYMIKYGMSLWQLRWGTVMSTINVSNAWYYAVVPLSGVITTFVGFVFLMNTILKIIEDRINKKEGIIAEEDQMKGIEAKFARELSEAQDNK